MVFSHRDTPTRIASLEPIENGVLLHHIDKAGRPKKKTFKGGYYHDKALRFLLNKEGYIIRAPQEGRLQWMTKFLSDNRGESTHCVHPESGVIWADGKDGFLYKVSLGPGQSRENITTQKVAYGEATTLVCGAQGRAISMHRSFKNVAKGYFVNCVIKSTDPQTLKSTNISSFSIGHLSRTLWQISTSSAGILLAGCSDANAALYDPEGKITQRFTLQGPTKKEDEDAIPQASGGISKNGQWVAFSHGRSIRRISLKDKSEVIYPATFKNIENIQISDEGEVYVTGFQFPSHAMFKVDEKGTKKISADYRATLLPNRQFIETQYNRVTLRSLDEDAKNITPSSYMKIIGEWEIPELGMAKHAKAKTFTKDSVIVFTDAYTLSEVNIQT